MTMIPSQQGIILAVESSYYGELNMTVYLRHVGKLALFVTEIVLNDASGVDLKISFSNSSNQIYYIGDYARDGSRVQTSLFLKLFYRVAHQHLIPSGFPHVWQGDIILFQCGVNQAALEHIYEPHCRFSIMCQLSDLAETMGALTKSHPGPQKFNIDSTGSWSRVEDALVS